jgi:hypothetical protein
MDDGAPGRPGHGGAPGLVPALRFSPTSRIEDHWDDLLGAACDARRTGWRSWERDPVVALVRALGLVIWPAALERLVRQAREEVG